jgi:uncharacterized membrane protein YqaE (UPF0057 family)
LPSPVNRDDLFCTVCSEAFFSSSANVAPGPSANEPGASDCRHGFLHGTDDESGIDVIQGSALPAATVHPTKRQQRANNCVNSDICKILLAIFLPPLGVFLERGCGADFFINILLTILGKDISHHPPHRAILAHLGTC